MLFCLNDMVDRLWIRFKEVYMYGLYFLLSGYSLDNERGDDLDLRRRL